MKKQNNLVKKFQILAGIIKKETVATLEVPNSPLIQLKNKANGFDKLRYKLCGFKYSEVNDIKTRLTENVCKCQSNEDIDHDITMDDLDEIVKELENEGK